jgi:hypothetical protein
VRRVGKAVLAGEVVLAWLRVRVAMRGRDLPTALARLRRPGRVPTAAEPERLARAVQRTLPLLPADSRCLTQSLVLTNLLARRGVSSTLVIGVAAPDDEPFGAHAWVELEHRALLPGGNEAYPRLVEL